MAFEDKKQGPRIRRKKTCWFTEKEQPVLSDLAVKRFH